MDGADNRPEALINYYVKSAMAARNIASAAGFFALLWSTVVLLGGFVSVLTIKDFWSLSVLSLLMASQLILMEMKIRTSWDYVADMHILRLSKGQKIRLNWVNRLRHWAAILTVSIGLVVKTIVAICIALPIIVVGPYVAMGLSVVRLVQRDYGDAGGDAANRAKLNVALIIFYVLVIFQSSFVLFWGIVAAFLGGPVPWMLVRKQLGFGVWGANIVWKYQLKTQSKYNKDGFFPYNWNLITFSVGLLESASQEDRLWGARMLDTFTGKGVPIKEELLSSTRAIQNLIDMIGLISTEDNPEIRERATIIVADLASELRITQFPDVLRSICCLLESCKHYSDTKTSKRMDKQKNLSGNSYVPKGTKELIFQGLVILERLSQDEDNCIEIIKHQRLLSKITLPMNYHNFLSNGCDHTWVKILCRSLTVVSRLINVKPGDDATRLRHNISRNEVAILNLMRTLEVDSGGARELHGLAIEILTELAFDDSFRKLAFDKSTSMTEMIVKRLRRILLDESNVIVAKEDEVRHKRVRRKAGEALTRLLRVPSARDDTVALTSATNLNDVELCSKQDVINLLTWVVNHILLSSKGEKAEDVVTLAGPSSGFHVEMVVESLPQNASTQETEKQSEDNKMLAAMLSLTVAICNRSAVSADDFTHAIPNNTALVKKLKEVVETNMDITTEGWRIIKLVCEVVIAMALLKPSYTREFNKHHLKETLSKALDTMLDVDNYMPFGGNGHEVPVRSLASLVEEAQELLAQEQGDIIST